MEVQTVQNPSLCLHAYSSITHSKYNEEIVYFTIILGMDRFLGKQYKQKTPDFIIKVI